MINRAFQYDLSSEKWIECTDEKFINDDIENLPSVIIVKYTWIDDKNFLFCPKHKKVEEIISQENSKIISYENCKFDGLKAVVKISRNEHENYYRNVYDIPVRWRIFQNSPESPMNLAADIIKLEYNNWHRTFLKHYENYFINVSMQKKICVIKKIDGKNWTNVNTKIQIPKIVEDVAMEILLESTKIFMD